MSRSTMRPRVLRTLVGALAAGLCAFAAAAPTASAASNFECIVAGDPVQTADANVDDTIGLSVGFTADFPDVVAGQPFGIQPVVNYNLSNEYLVSLGKRGYLANGENNLGGMTFWVAIAATNTVEQRQIMRATVNPTANTRVIWDSAAETASVQKYSGNPATPSGPPSASLAGSATLNNTGISWTPTSTAPVSLSVAAIGSLGELKVADQWLRNSPYASFPSSGTPDTLAAARPYGNVYTRIKLGANAPSNGFTSLDCVSGNVILTNDTIAYTERGNVLPVDGGDRGRYTVQGDSNAPFATVTPEPTAKPFTCIDGLGRYVGRELNGYQVAIRSGAPGTFTAGAPYSLSGVAIDITVPSVMIKGLYSNLYSYQQLPAGGIIDQPFTLWLAVRGANTTEGVQVVKVESRWSAQFVDPDGVVGSGDEVFPAVNLSFPVPGLTWTPTGAGPVSFTVAEPGLIPALTLVGRGHSGAEGAIFPMSPYGSLFIRAETGRYGESIDCLEGSVQIANPAIGFSNLGRNSPDVKIPTPVPAGQPPSGQTVASGSAGRYAIAHKPAAPFAIATAAVAEAPKPEPKKALPSLKSKSLDVDRKAKVGVAIDCTTGAATACKGTVKVKTAKKVKVGKKGKKRVVTLTKAVRYTVSAGTSKTVKIGLTKTAKNLLEGRRSLRVTVVIDPSDGKAITRTVTLRP